MPERTRVIPDRYQELSVVMGLPLVDGVLVSLVAAGALNTALEMIQVGVLVFGGAAVTSVVVSNFREYSRARAVRIGLFGLGLAIVAAAEAFVAPSLLSVINQTVLQRTAVLSLLIIGLKQLPVAQTTWLPSPAVVILIGAGLGFQPSELVISYAAPAASLYAFGAVLTGTVTALIALRAGDRIQRDVGVDTIRRVSGAALLAVALSVLGVVPEIAPLGVAAGATVVYALA